MRVFRPHLELRWTAKRAGFTPSERVAIKKAIQDEIGNRQGNRTDKELVVNCPEVKAGEQTRSIASKRAGFTSEMTSRRAERVVNRGIPELAGKREWA